MNKLKSYYFSGTGNAKQIALWFSEYAEEKMIETQILDISRVNSFEKNDADTTLMIISPVHGFNFPKITIDFIRKLPQGNNNVILMDTRAGLRIGNFVTPGLTGIAFWVSKAILIRKGYKVIGQIPFDMPSNWFFLHPSLTQKTVDFIFEKNHCRLKKHFDTLYEKNKNFASRKDLIQDILISPVSIAYYLLGRFVLAKSFYASSKCTTCKLCIKQCPAKAIKEVDNNPFWTFRCESCMKCMVSCPEKAIESAHGLILGGSIICSLLFSTLSGLILSDFVNSIIFKVLGFTILLLLYLWFFYWLQHKLLKNSFFQKVITLTSLTHYKFWGKRNPKPSKK